jgi:nucleotide-binding universal stress UspA family protein
MKRKRLEESGARGSYSGAMAQKFERNTMSDISSILVHMDASPRCAERLALALSLAHEHGAATLVALLALQPREVPLQVPVGADWGAIPTELEIDPEHRRLARATLVQALATGDTALTWAEVPDDPPVWGMAQGALYTDVMVLGQFDKDDPLTRDVPHDFVESVLLESGKPGLVVPHAGRFPAVGRNMLVAWKPTRECARAVAAAMPMLQRAERVHVVSWGEDNFGPAETTFGIARALSWHGVEAVTHRYEETPGELGELLLSKASDFGSDMLVMGCYGHHRIRELLLGGTTRTILKSMTLPVFMSH